MCGRPLKEDTCYQVHASATADTWKTPQKLKQVCKSRQVREAVSDRLMLGVPEFSGQGAPAIVCYCANLPSVCHMLSKSMVFNGSQCWQAVTISENSSAGDGKYLHKSLHADLYTKSISDISIMESS